MKEMKELDKIANDFSDGIITRKDAFRAVRNWGVKYDPIWTQTASTVHRYLNSIERHTAVK